MYRGVRFGGAAVVSIFKALLETLCLNMHALEEKYCPVLLLLTPVRGEHQI